MATKDGSNKAPPPIKIEGLAERWWISSIMNEGGEPQLFGMFYGLESIGMPEGEFQTTAFLKLDLSNRVVETDKAYIKLGEPQHVFKVLARIEKQLAKAALTGHPSVRKPDKT